MEMLHGMYGLEGSPVLEPDAISSANVISESLVDVRIDLLPG